MPDDKKKIKRQSKKTETILDITTGHCEVGYGTSAV